MLDKQSKTELRESIRDHEGHPEFPYLDSLGIATAGIGHRIEDDLPIPGETVGALLRRYSSPELHEHWFDLDVEQAIRDAVTFTGRGAWLQLSNERRKVIAEMAFQMGLTRLGTFKKFRARIHEGDHKAAASEMIDSKWYRQAPQRAMTLAKRYARG